MNEHGWKLMNNDGNELTFKEVDEKWMNGWTWMKEKMKNRWAWMKNGWNMGGHGYKLIEMDEKWWTVVENG